MDGAGTVEEKEMGLALSKGSASPSATNDSWKTPKPISGRAASGDGNGIRKAWSSFVEGVERVEEKRNGTGASPKGQCRPVRPTTAGRRQTPFLAGRPRETAREFGKLGQVLWKALKE